jgi:TonB family protein
MLSRSTQTIQPESATGNAMPHIVGAGLVALIVAHLSLWATQTAPPGQSIGPAQTFSPAPAASPPVPVAPPLEAAPQPGTLPAVLGAPPTVPERSETPVPATGTPPAAEAPTGAASFAEQAASVLPKDLTPYGMFMSADIIVKAVMIGLMFASVLTWTIWLAKTLELLGVRRRLNRAQRPLRAARSLADAGTLAAHLERFKRYPDKARARGDQATTTVAFTIDHDGRLVTSRVVQSSGSQTLDEETLAMLVRAQPLPKPPDNVLVSELSFVVPIKFSIK